MLVPQIALYLSIYSYTPTYMLKYGEWESRTWSEAAGPPHHLQVPATVHSSHGSHQKKNEKSQQVKSCRSASLRTAWAAMVDSKLKFSNPHSDSFMSVTVTGSEHCTHTPSGTAKALAQTSESQMNMALKNTKPQTLDWLFFCLKPASHTTNLPNLTQWWQWVASHA